jgi:hypothetical protein
MKTLAEIIDYVFTNFKGHAAPTYVQKFFEDPKYKSYNTEWDLISDSPTDLKTMKTHMRLSVYQNPLNFSKTPQEMDDFLIQRAAASKEMHQPKRPKTQIFIYRRFLKVHA